MVVFYAGGGGNVALLPVAVVALWKAEKGVGKS